MSKTKKYAINGALAGGIIAAIYNAIKQVDRIETNPNLKFNWKEVLQQAGKGALIGGSGGFLLGAIKDHQNSLEKPVNTDAFLYNTIAELQLDKSDRFYIRLNEIADKLIELIKQEFHRELFSEPFKVGSTQKGTALNENWDIDISVPFRTDGFRSIKDMYDSVAFFFSKKVHSHSIASVRYQGKSIGVYVTIQGREHKIDIVPNRIIRKRGNKTEGVLYVSKKSAFNDTYTYQKTNIPLLNNVKYTETQKKIIILLKKWRNDNSLPLTSHLLEVLVLEAYKFNQNKIPRTFTKKVIMVLQYIADSLDSKLIRSIENTNNILTNISDSSKVTIIDACVRAVKEYRYQPNSIIETFSTN